MSSSTMQGGTPLRLMKRSMAHGGARLQPCTRGSNAAHEKSDSILKLRPTEVFFESKTGRIIH